MGHLAAPPLETEDDTTPSGAASPQVFVRTFSAPPGMPWDQARAARLEARHGAPLPIADLAHRLRRLGGWAPGRAGRYAVFYVRRKDFIQPFETTVDVDGAALKVAFGAGAEQLQRARRLGLLLVSVAVTVAILAAGTMMALRARAEAARQLEGLETQAAARLRQAERADRARRVSLALSRVQGQAGAPGEVVADLAWLTRAKAPEARIVAIHWDHGMFAVEARGEIPPVQSSERRIVRSAQALRPGVFVWGIDRAGSATAEAAAPIEGRGP